LANGTVNYAVAANPTPFTRTGNILVGAQQFQIRQDAAPCTTTLAQSSASVAAGATTGSVGITVTPSGCTWSATSGAPTFITVTSGASGTNSGTVGYAVSPNTGALRTGTIKVNDQTFTITQAAAACSYTAVANPSNFSAAGGSGTVTLTTTTGCAWTAAANATWLAITSAGSGSGPASISFTVAANTGAQRSGTLTIGGQTVTIQQDAPAAGNSPQLTSVKNAASYTAGTVSAGEIVTLLGSNLGPDPLVTMQYTADGQSLVTNLSGTRVLFDGVAAPMVYTWAPQVSAVVPYGVDGKTTTQVQVEYKGVLSNAVTVNVAPSVPGIFSLDSTGVGQGAVLNQDYSVNGPNNPAARGTVVQIFATGGGQTNPPGTDGQLVAPPYPQLILPIKVTIGGLDAAVQYAGAAPGEVAGMLQINAVISPDVQPGGAVPVVVQIGSAQTQDGITIAIQ
jgi:uncharacterized protein (TIGR03437 family)